MTARAMPAEVQKAFSEVLEDIRPGYGSSAEKLALACAALTMLAAQPNSQVFPLQDSLPSLTQLLDHEQAMVQVRLTLVLRPIFLGYQYLFWALHPHEKVC